MVKHGTSELLKRIIFNGSAIHNGFKFIFDGVNGKISIVDGIGDYPTDPMPIIDFAEWINSATMPIVAE